MAVNVRVVTEDSINAAYTSNQPIGASYTANQLVKGDDGTTFTPSVSEEGVISWTNDGDKPNPEPVNITGPEGTPGQDGEPGEDGFSPVVSVSSITGGNRVTITDAVGDTSFDVMDGTDGQDGQDGQDGVSPIISSTPITGGNQISITDASGTTTVDVMDGIGVPTGGLAGDVLRKASSANYDYDWDNLETYKVVRVNSGDFNAFPKTIVDPRILQDMKVIEVVWSNPSAITSDVTWNTDTAGELTLSGTISGTTSADITLISDEVVQQADASTAMDMAIATQGMMAEEYSSNLTYAVGDYCTYDDVLYRCTTAITTAETFTPAHWTSVKLANDKVSRSGDTMTGGLTNTETIAIKNADYAVGNTPSADSYKFFKHSDKNNNTYAYFFGRIATDGRIGAGISTTRTVNNSPVYNGFTEFIDASGNRSVAFDAPAAWRSALGFGTIGTVNISTSVACKTTMTYTGVHVNIPAGCIYSITASANWNGSKPVVINIAASSTNVNSSAASGNFSHVSANATASGYTGSAAKELYIWAQYSAEANNNIGLSGYYMSIGA